MSAALAAAVVAGPAAAQTRTALLRENGPVPGLVGATVSSISATAANQTGGRAAIANVDDGLGATLSLAYGRGTSTGTDGVLFSEGLYGTCQQTSWEGFFGLSDIGNVAYSPSCDDTLSGLTGLDSTFVDAFPVAVEGDPILGLPGKVFRFNSRVSITSLGQPVWICGINDAGGAVEGNGLAMGFTQDVLLKTGDMPPGVDFPLDGNAVDFDFRFSPSGNHYITAVDQLSGSTLNDGRIVLDGVGLDLAGAQVEENTPIPGSIGGIGAENWDNFDFFGILDDGTFLMTGDTDNSDTGVDEFVFFDGQMLYREGDTLGDGNVLRGSIEGGYLAGNGDLGLVWDIDDGSGGDIEAMLFNGRVVAAEGDAVDFDGDGLVDPNATISGFTGLASLSAGTDQRLYVTADVDTLGTTSTTDDTEVFLEVAVQPLVDRQAGQAISLLAGGSHDLTLFVPQSVQADVYFVLGSVSGTAPGTPAGTFLLPLNLDAYTNFTLTTPNSALLSGSFGVPDAFGVADCSFNVPPGSNASLAGTVVSHAYVTFAIGAALEVSFASNAVSLTLAP